jgi:hypothetical protein
MTVASNVTADGGGELVAAVASAASDGHAAINPKQKQIKRKARTFATSFTQQKRRPNGRRFRQKQPK